MAEARSGILGRRIVMALAVLGLVESAWLAFPHVQALVLQYEETPAARGAKLAAELGCFACHGPAGGGGTRNPSVSSEGGEGGRSVTILGQEAEVPAFTENTQMMYVKTTDDLREYILDGAPKRRREDPEYRAKMDAAALKMPAYRGRVSAAQVEDLVAYLRATSGQLASEEKLVQRGADLAVELSCAVCHGPLGGGGVANPGSFKGYIPAFWGSDFDELVQNDGELRQWIADGKIDRIAEHPIGKFFFRRQVIKMPAYRQYLPPADINALVRWVRWVRDGSWRKDIK